MTWIKTEFGMIVNADRLQCIKVWEAEKIKTRKNSEGDLVTAQDAPAEGYVVIGWDGDEPLWLTGGHDAYVVHQLEECLFAALLAGLRGFDVERSLFKLPPTQTS